MTRRWQVASLSPEAAKLFCTPGGLANGKLTMPIVRTLLR
jgi:hypothetical protein